MLDKIFSCVNLNVEVLVLLRIFCCFIDIVVNQFVNSISDDHCYIGTKVGPSCLDLEMKKEYKPENVVDNIGLRQNVL